MNDPARNLKIKVYARGDRDQMSHIPAQIVVTNPQPGLPTGVSIDAGFDTIFMKYNSPPDLDFKGMLVWLSLATGFTPDDANKVYEGPNNVIFIRSLTDGTAIIPNTNYYLRYAPYDEFGKTDLNISAELELTTIPLDGNYIAAATIGNAHIVNLSGDKILAGTISADKYLELRQSLPFTYSESLDSNSPFEADFYILSEMTNIQTVLLSFKIKPFRAYSKAAANSSEVVGSSGPAGLPSAHTHILYGQDRSGGNAVYYNPTLLAFEYSGGSTLKVYFNTVEGHRHYLEVKPVGSTSGKKRMSVSPFGINCDGGGIVISTVEDAHSHNVDIGLGPVGRLVNIRSIGGGNGEFIADDISPFAFVAEQTDSHTHDIVVPAHSHDLEYGIFEEANTPTINLYVNNGSGYGNSIGEYTADQLELALTSHFSSSGWKAIKFTSDALCRIVATLALKLDITA